MVQVSLWQARWCILTEASRAGNAFVSHSLTVANATHELVRYPLAYSLMVLPLSIARWSLFNHRKVSSAATFFGVCLFNLSGAINVLLFLILRPQLLLFSPPEEYSECGVEPTTSSAIFSDTANYEPGAQPTGIELMGRVGDGIGNSTLESGNIIAPSYVDSRPTLNDI